MRPPVREGAYSKAGGGCHYGRRGVPAVVGRVPLDKDEARRRGDRLADRRHL